MKTVLLNISGTDALTFSGEDYTLLLFLTPSEMDHISPVTITKFGEGADELSCFIDVSKEIKDHFLIKCNKNDEEWARFHYIRDKDKFINYLMDHFRKLNPELDKDNTEFYIHKYACTMLYSGLFQHGVYRWGVDYQSIIRDTLPEIYQHPEVTYLHTITNGEDDFLAFGLKKDVEERILITYSKTYSESGDHERHEWNILSEDGKDGLYKYLAEQVFSLNVHNDYMEACEVASNMLEGILYALDRGILEDPNGDGETSNEKVGGNTHDVH